MTLDTRYSLHYLLGVVVLKWGGKNRQYLRSHFRAKPMFFPDMVHAYNFSMGDVEAGGLEV